MTYLSQKNWFSGILALLFTLLLFFNANAQENISANVGVNQFYDEMIYDVPVQLEYDKDKYFVSGYEETVNVQLSSANRVQLNRESNEDTRKFRVVANLSEVPVGTSEVQLKVEGLSNAVKANIEPQTITATIEKKVSKTFKVQAKLPDSLESEGYKIDKVTLAPKEVKITTGEETLKSISKVVAPISNTKQSSDTIQQKVNVQAVNKNGETLAIENPAPQVDVTVDLTVPKKEVTLRPVSSGSVPSGVDNFSFAFSETKAEIRGPNSILSSIDAIDVPVDISNIHSVTKQTIKLPTSDDFVTVPTEVVVTITPSYTNSQSSYFEGGSSTTSYHQNNQDTSGTTFDEPAQGDGGTSSSTSTSSTTSNSSSTTDEPSVDSSKKE